MTNKEYSLKLNCYAYLKELYPNKEISLDIKVSKLNCIVEINGKRELIKIDWLNNWINSKN